MRRFSKDRDGQMDGQMDGQINKQVDRWINGQIYRQINKPMKENFSLIYVYVSYSWPNGQTKFADFCLGNPQAAYG